MKGVVLAAAFLFVGMASGEDLTIRVLTYNIHHGAGTDGNLDLARIAACIRATGADIVCLQEVDKLMERTGRRDFPAYFASELDMTAVFEANLRVGEGQYGNAVLTRYPVLNHENIPLPVPEGIEPRGCLRVRIQTGEHVIDVFNTHLGLDAKERLDQASVIAQNLPPKDVPHILAGDLNEAYSEPALQLLLKRLDDSVPELNAPQYFTVPSDTPRNRIDYVLLSRHFEPVSVRVVADERAQVASDHLPYLVEARFTVRGSAQKWGDYPQLEAQDDERLNNAPPALPEQLR